MDNSEITNVLVTELSKISDNIVPWCIIITIILVIAGLAIGSIKKAFRKIFK